MQPPPFSEPGPGAPPSLEDRVKHLEDRLAALEQKSAGGAVSVHPAAGLVLGLLGAGALALAVIFLFDGSQQHFYLYYFVPIAVPFIAFLIGRLRFYLQPLRLFLALAGIDLVVLSLSLVRSFYPLPLISGHAMFLGFALLTVRSIWERAAVVAVLAQVVYLKLIAWGGDPTLFGGLAAGCAAGLLWRWLSSAQGQPAASNPVEQVQ